MKEWDEISYVLSNENEFITREEAKEIITNHDKSKVSGMLKRWVAQGLLNIEEPGAKKAARYSLPSGGNFVTTTVV
jgi:hypothetical protein